MATQQPTCWTCKYWQHTHPAHGFRCARFNGYRQEPCGAWQREPGADDGEFPRMEWEGRK